MKFRVILADDEDDIATAREFEAHDAEQAATKWAERYDSDDYPLSNGGYENCVVQCVETGVITRWNCAAEHVTYYTAMPL